VKLYLDNQLKKDTSVHESIFRDYDIRGKLSAELSLEGIYELGCAIAYYFLHECDSIKTVVIGKDGCEATHLIEQEIIRALRGSGIEVITLGICPLPVLSFSLHVLPVDIGLMISNCDEEKEYSKIVFRLAKGSLQNTFIAKIKKLYYEGKASLTFRTGFLSYYPMVDRYILWLARQFNHLTKSELRCVIHCEHQATANVLQRLVEILQFSHVKVFAYTRESSLSAGFIILFSGNAGYMSVFTSAGKLVKPDTLFTLYAYDIFLRSFKRRHYQETFSTVFDDIVKESKKLYYPTYSKHGLINQEDSYHFFFNDCYFGYDDNIYAVLRLWAILDRCGKSFEEMLFSLPGNSTVPGICSSKPLQV
jgi:phosphomannomutase